MNNSLRTELTEKFPKLGSQLHWEAIPAEAADAYKTGPKVDLLNPFNAYRKSQVLRLPVYDIATYFPLFVRVQKMFESSDANYFKFFYNNNGSLSNISLSRSDIVKTLESLVDYELVSEDGSHIGYAFEQLANLASPQRLIDLEKGKPFSVEMDGKHFEFDSADFIKFMIQPDVAFNHELYNFNPAEHDGCTLPEYMHALKVYAQQSNMFAKAYFSDSQITRFQNIFHNQTIDSEAINQHTEDENRYLSKTVISPELEQAILGDMNPAYNDLQKAQYIYLKMCQTLTYNPEFFAINQKGPRVKPHQDIGYVAGITPENCEAVCYEFSVLYGKFLQQATGIKHELVFQNSYFGSGRYGNDHTLVEFRCGKFLVTADSVKGILNSDLTNQKLDRPILGLNCTNANKETVKEFRDSLRAVAEDLRVETFNKTRQNASSNFETAMQEFKELTADDNVYIDPQTKLDFVLQQISESQLRGMDAFAYLLQLRKVTFTKEEQHKNVAVNIVREEPANPQGQILTTGVITLSTNYRDSDEEMSYLLFRPIQGKISSNNGDQSSGFIDTPQVEEISREDLIARFENKQISYISSNDEAIPGLGLAICRDYMVNEYVPDP